MTKDRGTKIRFASNRDLVIMEMKLLRFVNLVQTIYEDDNVETQDALYRAQLTVFSRHFEELHGYTPAQWIAQSGSETHAFNTIKSIMDKMRGQRDQEKQMKLVMSSVHRL